MSHIHIHIPHQSGENPIHIAVRHAHFPIVKLLIDFLHNEMSRLDAIMAVNEQSVVRDK